MCKAQGTLTSPIPPPTPQPQTHPLRSINLMMKNTLSSGTSLTASAKTRSTHLSWCDLDIMVCTHFTSYIYIYIYIYLRIYIYIYTCIYIYRIIHRISLCNGISIRCSTASFWLIEVCTIVGPRRSWTSKLGVTSDHSQQPSMAYPTDQVQSVCLFQGGYGNIFFKKQHTHTHIYIYIYTVYFFKKSSLG